MGFEVESTKQLIQLTEPELTPDEAGQYLPVAQAQLAEQTREHEKAKAESARCMGVCDQNKDTMRFLSSKSAALTAERDELKANLRIELYSTHDDCDVEGVSGMLRRKTDAVDFVDSAYSFLVEVKNPADTILWLDARANEAVAEHSAICAAAVLNRTRTIAALGPILASEGGAVGVIGGLTETLKAQAQAAYKRIESARNAARDARLSYERAQSARISRGLVKSANVIHAIGH